MKIKVTLTATRTKKFYEGDDIPNGIYLDAEDDIVVYDGGDTACFSDDGAVLTGMPVYPITPAPKGTKIEITN